MTTLSAIYRSARTRLTDAGIETAALDARLLVGDVTGSTLEDIVCRPMEPVSPDAASRLETLIERRIAGESVHRIIGRRAFFGLDLAMSSETLEPRPDTEALVELVLPHARRIASASGRCRILDLGTGTGAIGLALANELPQAHVVLADISQEALATACSNASALGLDERISVVASDWYSNIEGIFDLIVSNPPYIRTEDIGRLAPEVRIFDPWRALDGGDDGLDAYRRIAAGAKEHLERGGMVALEIGVGQGADVTALFEAHGLTFVASAADMGGIERALLLSLR